MSVWRSGPLSEEERFDAIREVWQSEVSPIAHLLAEGASPPPGMSSRDAAAYAAQVIERVIEQLQRPRWYLRGLGVCPPPERDGEEAA